MLMNEHDDACVNAMLMVNMQANTRSVTSCDEIFVRGEGSNTPSVSLHVNHEHCINISIIMITHEHHTVITCHLLHALCG